MSNIRTIEIRITFDDDQVKAEVVPGQGAAETKQTVSVIQNEQTAANAGAAPTAPINAQGQGSASRQAPLGTDLTVPTVPAVTFSESDIDTVGDGWIDAGSGPQTPEGD